MMEPKVEYDESIEDNKFFRRLQEDYSDLIQRATTDNWIICVPRVDTVANLDITEVFILEHILVPDVELPESHFMTLTKATVQIRDNVLAVKTEQNHKTNNVPVLFKQVFYTKGVKYQVWCLEHPLTLRKHPTVNDKLCLKYVNNTHDCIRLLAIECPKVLPYAQMQVDAFIKNNVDFITAPLDFTVVETKRLYTECVDYMLEDKQLANKLSINLRLLMQVQLAVEMYMQYCFGSLLFDVVTNCTSCEDAHFNKIVRNAQHLQLKHFDIAPAFYERITRAKSVIITKLNNHQRNNNNNNNCTAMDKARCLKETFDVLKTERATLTADSLLHIFIFLIVKTNVNNWIANLTFLCNFQHNAAMFSSSSSSSSSCCDENRFLLTTLEAAVEYVKSGGVFLLGKKRNNHEDAAPIADIFKAVKRGDYDTMEALLNHDVDYDDNNINTGSSSSSSSLLLCHPLCSCEHCDTTFNEPNNRRKHPNSRDAKGRTLLHLACWHGHARIVDRLLTRGAAADARDFAEATPLHYACTRGHQNCTLLLLHHDNRMEIAQLVDSDGNTALHLAARNGHENCVKALLYFSECNNNNSVNNMTSPRNNWHDTPLHFASLWGYLGIVDILLQYNVEVDVRNKRQQAPIDLAANVYVRRRLLAANDNNNNHREYQSNAGRLISVTLNGNARAKRKKSQQQQKHRRVERLLKAIEDGDEQLTKFYLGLRSAPLSGRFVVNGRRGSSRGRSDGGLSGMSKVSHDRRSINSVDDSLASYTNLEDKNIEDVFKTNSLDPECRSIKRIEDKNIKTASVSSSSSTLNKTNSIEHEYGGIRNLEDKNIKTVNDHNSSVSTFNKRNSLNPEHDCNKDLEGKNINTDDGSTFSNRYLENENMESVNDYNASTLSSSILDKTNSFDPEFKGNKNLNTDNIEDQNMKTVNVQDTSSSLSSSTFNETNSLDHESTKSCPIVNVLSTECHPLCDCAKCHPDSSQRASTDSSDDDTPIPNRARQKARQIENDGDDNCNGNEGATIASTINNNININDCDANGQAAVHFAAKFGRSAILRLLLDSGADVNVLTRDRAKKSALHLAAEAGHVDCVKELLKCGSCMVDIADGNGETPLHLAVRANKERAVEVLLVVGGADAGRKMKMVTPSRASGDCGRERALVVTTRMGRSERIVQLLERFSVAV